MGWESSYADGAEEENREDGEDNAGESDEVVEDAEGERRWW